MSKHIMIDVETLGLEPDSAVMQIGLVYFEDRGGDYNEIDSLDIRLNPFDQPTRKIDSKTVEWWHETDKELFFSLLLPGENAMSLFLAEGLLCRAWGKVGDDTQVWCNGPDFDFAFLKSLFGKLPWPHDLQRDYRTVREMFLPEDQRLERTAEKHDALGDARYQAKSLCMILGKLERGDW